MERKEASRYTDVINRLPDPLAFLQRIVPAGILKMFIQGGTLHIPKRGPGSYSIPNALRRATLNEEPPPTTLVGRRNSNRSLFRKY